MNQDTLKTVEKCILAAQAAIRRGKSVVVDNTNTLLPVREKWLKLGADLGIPVMAVVLGTPKEVAFLLINYRLWSPLSPPADRREVPDVVVHTQYKYMVLPTTLEGFHSVHTVRNELQETEDERANMLFRCYLK